MNIVYIINMTTSKKEGAEIYKHTLTIMGMGETFFIIHDKSFPPCPGYFYCPHDNSLVDYDIILLIIIIKRPHTTTMIS